jgi:hypothetical protein
VVAVVVVAAVVVAAVAVAMIARRAGNRRRFRLGECSNFCCTSNQVQIRLI